MNKRKVVVRLPGQTRKKLNKWGHAPTETVDTSAAIAGGRWGESKYWQLRLDECDKFSDVKIYDTDGVTLIRTVSKDDLKRPMPLKPGQGWNTILFPVVK